MVAAHVPAGGQLQVDLELKTPVNWGEMYLGSKSKTDKTDSICYFNLWIRWHEH